MYTKLLFSLLLVMPRIGYGQKLFFHFVKPTVYAYTDQLWLSKSNWPQAVLPPSAIASQNFDSLSAVIPKDGRWFGPSGGNGLRLSLERNLLVLKGGRRSLRWSAGLGYHRFRSKSVSYSYYPYLLDTAKMYQPENVRFELRQSYLDVYNAVAYQVEAKTIPNFLLSVGVSLQFSVPITSKIKETYSTGSIQWNAAQRRWHESERMHREAVLPARKNAIVSAGLPVELGFRGPKNNTISFGVEFVRRYRLSVFDPDLARSAAALFSFSFVHSLQ